MIEIEKAGEKMANTVTTIKARENLLRLMQVLPRCLQSLMSGGEMEVMIRIHVCQSCQQLT
ncbi:hypothetical protein JS44_12475 [Anoxybacillus flavithermus]|uniref:Uncharacterized protein n=1 Tax=Anoxybacillus flavithermus TaxID=33934 RepID=A0A094IX76_9BACL|nr:hypothetical protein JS44_12475 [Anoxybacillus flavithermus]